MEVAHFLLHPFLLKYQMFIGPENQTSQVLVIKSARHRTISVQNEVQIGESSGSEKDPMGGLKFNEALDKHDASMEVYGGEKHYSEGYDYHEGVYEGEYDFYQGGCEGGGKYVEGEYGSYEEGYEGGEDRQIGELNVDGFLGVGVTLADAGYDLL